MITYDKSAFGLNLIFRVHGSACYRAIVPGLLSAIVLLMMRYIRSDDGTLSSESRLEDDLNHPYALGVLVASITFIVVFRLNQGYGRYWEAASNVHQMMSKWLDAITHTACYHMQCAHYDQIKPPSFFDYPELNAYYLTRDRERHFEPTSNRYVMEDLDDGQHDREEEEEVREDYSRRKVMAAVAEQITTRTGVKRRQVRGQKMSNHSDRSVDFDLPSVGGSKHTYVLDRAIHKSIQPVGVKNAKIHAQRHERLKKACSTSKGLAPSGRTGVAGADPTPLTAPPRLDGNWGKLFPDKKATYYQPRDWDPSSPNYLYDIPSFASHQGGRTPALFLQELAHLCSLMNAVALSTLRNDMEGSVSPLGVFKPGAPWPEVDPDKIDSYFLQGPWYTRLGIRIWYFLGFPRSLEERTRYNAARPLEVIGGVSDAEIRFLQMARGALAKTQLTWYWLSEFIVREHLNGSTGKVGPPIISRIFQFLSDGMISYNQSRKIMFIPFPFPHAQLSALFVLVAIPAVAFLMDQYADNVWLGAVLCFSSVACLSGAHEVARELENPFRNIPNELPVCTLQAQFNEALITMFSGYHPDHFWDAKGHDHHPSDPSPRRGRGSHKSRTASHAANNTGTKSTSPPSCKASDHRSPSTRSRSPTRLISRSSSEVVPAVPSSASPPLSPLAVNPQNESSAEADLTAIQAKMEEYGKEIERLRGLLENSAKIESR